jgi:hypothetical protein
MPADTAVDPRHKAEDDGGGREDTADPTFRVRPDESKALKTGNFKLSLNIESNTLAGS